MGGNNFFIESSKRFTDLSMILRYSRSDIPRTSIPLTFKQRQKMRDTAVTGAHAYREWLAEHAARINQQQPKKRRVEDFLGTGSDTEYFPEPSATTKQEFAQRLKLLDSAWEALGHSCERVDLEQSITGLYTKTKREMPSILEYVSGGLERKYLSPRNFKEELVEGILDFVSGDPYINYSDDQLKLWMRGFNEASYGMSCFWKESVQWVSVTEREYAIDLALLWKAHEIMAHSDYYHFSSILLDDRQIFSLDEALIMSIINAAVRSRGRLFVEQLPDYPGEKTVEPIKKFFYAG
ncbi:hypothetical protein HYU14_07235 [Candidatus Woesearchaeota archaeon]|nr:hypothetical protein [Candidatus Woesearchaeota archaeon]